MGVFEMKVDREEIARINEYLKENRLRLTHFRYYKDDGTLNNRGGMTVVWKDNKAGRLFPVSTAICNSKDIFSRDIGRVLAAQNYERGHIIHLMTDRYDNCFQTLCRIFVG